MRAVLYLSINSSPTANTKALRVVRLLAEELGSSGTSINIVDVQDNPEKAEEDNVLAVPCLVVRRGEDRRLFIGDFEAQFPLMREALAL